MKTWEQKMEELVNGVVDYDDAEKLAMECAVVADRADCSKRHPGTWVRLMPELLKSWLQFATGEIAEDEFYHEREYIINCGVIADDAENGVLYDSGPIPV